ADGGAARSRAKAARTRPCEGRERQGRGYHPITHRPAPSPLARPPAMQPTSVALVHDYLLVMRGAERTFAAIAECFPDAPIYTLLYDEEGTNGRFAGREIKTSYLQRLGLGQKGFRALLPAFPRATR